ncbi:hypothetical protein [Sphingobacterium multivorum]|uniref:hypothetical protein n=1 Tax=Sphingobacterium multivorum TaxID=28454 RepID=UPI0028ABB647|nr:hypothetical protein [Sphingobacterium multivorum]
MCIYFKDKENLHYTSGEHIFPAGIGGIKKLPKEYVSLEFNNMISKVEQEFQRSSILALPRQFVGPGKRGSLNITKETKSKISVFRHQSDETVFSLGYISKGKPFEIPHIILNKSTGEYAVSIEHSSMINSDLKSFAENIRNALKLKTRLIKSDKLDEHTVLLGIKSGIEENYDCFIATQNGEINVFNENTLAAIATELENLKEFPQSESIHVVVHQSAKIGTDFYRCSAKIALNFLASFKGKKFVLDNRFDPVRNWIVNDGENNFAQFAESLPVEFKNIFPDESHQVFIHKKNNTLVAHVCYYNHFRSVIILSENFIEPFQPQGFICDWKSQREIDFYEYLLERKP